MARIYFILQLILASALLQGGAGQAQKTGPTHLPGPFAFEVLAVTDGDTFHARIPIWLNQNVVVKVRLRDIDTPELNGKCAREKRRARAARAFTAKWLKQNNVQLVNISYGVYAGRVLGTAQAANGQTLAQALRAAALAKPYRGKRAQWCD